LNTSPANPPTVSVSLQPSQPTNAPSDPRKKHSQRACVALKTIQPPIEWPKISAPKIPELFLDINQIVDQIAPTERLIYKILREFTAMRRRIEQGRAFEKTA